MLEFELFVYFFSFLAVSLSSLCLRSSECDSLAGNGSAGLLCPLCMMDDEKAALYTCGCDLVGANVTCSFILTLHR